MHPNLTAQCAAERHGECCSLGAASVARLFAYQPTTHGAMVATIRTELEVHSAGRRLMARLPLGRVRSWTGRSAVACATDSHLSRLTTAGTRVTRVSAMRALPVRFGRHTHEGAMVVTGRNTSQRRRDSAPLTGG